MPREGMDSGHRRLPQATPHTAPAVLLDIPVGPGPVAPLHHQPVGSFPPLVTVPVMHFLEDQGPQGPRDHQLPPQGRLPRRVHPSVQHPLPQVQSVPLPHELPGSPGPAPLFFPGGAVPYL